MISYLKGPLEEKGRDYVVVEAGGIGFTVYVPGSVLEALPHTGAEVVMHTYFQVREDAMSLYGFLNRQDLDMFKQLIGVNGIGPKGALGVLSVMRPDELRAAIISGDAKAISRAPGIGVKTAQRVILDLKDRIPTEDVLPQAFTGVSAVGLPKGSAAEEAALALVALGYSGAEASRAVSQVETDEGMTAEDVLKASLKHLTFL